MVGVVLWQRRPAYSGMFKVAESAAKLGTTLQQAVLSSLAMYELTEGDTPRRDFCSGITE